MKLQYFLRVFGVGIVLTAIVLCASYRVNGSHGGDVVEEAKKLGMVFPEGTQAPEHTKEPVFSQTATPGAIAEPEETGKPNRSAVSSGAGVTGEGNRAPDRKETAEPTVKPTAKPTKKPTAKPTTKPKKTKSSSNKSGKKFVVRSGLLSSSVAREMREAGIIKDEDAFDEYLEKSGYGRKVRSGTYYIPSGASYSEIAKIITRS